VKRTALTLVAIAAVLMSASAQANGNKPVPLGTSFGGVRGGSGINVVEQQSNYPYDSSAVTNPTGCAWDVNDWNDTGTDGYLNAGASYGMTVCQISDPDPVYRTLNGSAAWWSSPHGYFSGWVAAPSGALTVTACYQPQGRCFPLGSVNMGGEYDWLICSHAVYQGNPLDPAVTEIAGSNGGHGVVTDVTLTVTNPTGSRIKNIVLQAGVSSDSQKEPGCPYPGPPQTDYPFTWSTS